MTTGVDLDRARRAKGALVERFAGRPWFRGAGIVRVGDGYGVRLNVDPALDEALPDEARDVPVEVVRIGSYRPR